MPTYQNTTNEKKIVGSQILGPGKTYLTNVIFDPLPAGVVRISEEPIYNPVLHSAAYTGDANVAVPVGEQAYLVDLYVEAGTWEIQFNDAAMAPPLVLVEGTTWSRKYINRLIELIIMTRATPGGRIWVQLERI